MQAELLRRERETQVQAAQGFIDRLEDRVLENMTADDLEHPRALRGRLHRAGAAVCARDHDRADADGDDERGVGDHSRAPSKMLDLRTFALYWNSEGGDRGGTAARRRAPPLRGVRLETSHVLQTPNTCLRPLWEVRVERIARVELKADHVMLWTWEKIGPGTPTASYNMIFERLIHCNNAATLEAEVFRLWHVAEQRDRATIYAHRRTQA